MSKDELLILIQEKNELLVRLEFEKRSNKRELSSLARAVARLEGEIAGRHIANNNYDRATINLMSEASCLVDAGDYYEAIHTWARAKEIAPTTELKDWISKELEDCRSMIKPVGVGDLQIDASQPPESFQSKPNSSEAEARDTRKGDEKTPDKRLLEILLSSAWLKKLWRREAEIIVLGPPMAGRTSLLVGLVRTIGIIAQKYSELGITISITGGHDVLGNSMASLVLDTMSGEGFKESDVAHLDTFTLGFELKQSSAVWTAYSARVRVSLPRGVGFDILSNTSNGSTGDFRVEALGGAERIVYCVDLHGPETLRQYYFHFRELLKRRTRLRKIVFALTKADLFFGDSDYPQSSCCSDDPLLRLKEFFGEVLVSHIEHVCPSKEISAVWTSFYGFSPDGKSNWAKSGHLGVNVKAGYSKEEVDNSWEPFQILNLFV